MTSHGGTIPDSGHERETVHLRNGRTALILIPEDTDKWVLVRSTVIIHFATDNVQCF